MNRIKPARDRQRKVFQQRRRPGRWSQVLSGLLLLALNAIVHRLGSRFS
jgi:hypothetical protein